MWPFSSSQSRPDRYNTAAHQSDELVEYARQALLNRDAEQAMEALRQARILTPLREDIRLLAGEAAELRAAVNRRMPGPATPPTPLGASRILVDSPSPRSPIPEPAPAPRPVLRWLWRRKTV